MNLFGRKKAKPEVYIPAESKPAEVSQPLITTAQSTGANNSQQQQPQEPETPHFAPQRASLQSQLELPRVNLQIPTERQSSDRQPPMVREDNGLSSNRQPSVVREDNELRNRQQLRHRRRSTLESSISFSSTQYKVKPSKSKHTSKIVTPLHLHMLHNRRDDRRDSRSLYSSDDRGSETAGQKCRHCHKKRRPSTAVAIVPYSRKQEHCCEKKLDACSRCNKGLALCSGCQNDDRKQQHEIVVRIDVRPLVSGSYPMINGSYPMMNRSYPMINSFTTGMTNVPYPVNGYYSSIAGAPVFVSPDYYSGRSMHRSIADVENDE